uniref:Secreted protein n=1 Tax=Steinernema glaseri TaxID=37863 RepID=A0A1I7ZP27_9BILA
MTLSVCVLQKLSVSISTDCLCLYVTHRQLLEQFEASRTPFFLSAPIATEMGASGTFQLLTDSIDLLDHSVILLVAKLLSLTSVLVSRLMPSENA